MSVLVNMLCTCEHTVHMYILHLNMLHECTCEHAVYIHVFVYTHVHKYISEYCFIPFNKNSLYFCWEATILQI